jgi:DNA-directed RNA polymerase specialized sigma24 family protein
LSAATQLLERCLAGDPGAIESVFQTYQRPVFRLAYATLLDAQQAGRAMQAGLNSVLGALRQGMSEEEFQVVLFQHVLRACRAERRQTAWHKRQAAMQKRLSFLRIGKKAGQDKVDALNPHPLEAGLETYPDVISRRRAGLWQAMGRLPVDQRVALALRYEFELPLALAARVMHSSPGAVHARLSAARGVLGAVLDALQASQPPAPGGGPR